VEPPVNLAGILDDLRLLPPWLQRRFAARVASARRAAFALAVRAERENGPALPKSVDRQHIAKSVIDVGGGGEGA
jgi:hypothetical protein